MKLNRDLFRWTTKNGKSILVKDMKTKHIENTIKFLKEKSKLKPKNPTLESPRSSALDTIINLMNQELRYRKLNNIENNPDNKDLF